MKLNFILFLIGIVFYSCQNNQEKLPSILDEEYIKNLEAIDICELRNKLFTDNPIVKVRALYVGWNGEDLHLTGVDSCNDFQVSLAESPYFYFVENSEQKDAIIKRNNLDAFKKIKSLPKDKLILEIIGIYQRGWHYGHLGNYDQQIIPLEIKVLEFIED